MARLTTDRLHLKHFYLGLYGIICLLFISNLSYAQKKTNKSIYNQYDDKNKPKNVVKKKSIKVSGLKTTQKIDSNSSSQGQGILNNSITPQASQNEVSNPGQNEESKVNKDIIQTANGQNSSAQDSSKQLVNNDESKNSLETNAQVIKIEKHVELADVDTGKLNYVPWRIQFNLGTSQLSIQDTESKSSARLLSDVNYSLNSQYFMPINKTNQLSISLTNHLERYKNFSSRIQLSNVSFFRNDIKFSGHRVIQNELVLRYGLALKQSLVAYAVNSKFIELQNVPHSTIEFELEDRMFEYDQIHLYASIGLELQLSSRTQDYSIASGNSYYLGAQVKNKKIKNPSVIGFTFKQQNMNTSVSTQSRTDMNFSVGAEF